MGAEKKNSTDQVQLAYIKHKMGFSSERAVIVLRGKTHVIEFGKKGRFALSRKEANSYVAKSRQWGQAHMDNSPALAVVEMDDTLSVDLKKGDTPETPASTLVASGEKKIEDMGYNELIALAQSKGLEVTSGSIKKAELLEKLKAL